MSEFTKQELLIIWGSLTQSAINNEKRIDNELSGMFKELELLPGSDFDKRKEVRARMLNDITKEGQYIELLLNIAKRIKQMEQE